MDTDTPDQPAAHSILQTKTSNNCRSAAKIGEDNVKAPARIAEENMLKFETQHAQDNRHRDTVSSLDTRQGHNCSLQVNDVSIVKIDTAENSPTGGAESIQLATEATDQSAAHFVATKATSQPASHFVATEATSNEHFSKDNCPNCS